MSAIASLIECLDNLNMEWYPMQTRVGYEGISIIYETSKVLSSLNEIVRMVSVTYKPASNIMVFICHDVIKGLDELPEQVKNELYTYINELNAFHNNPGFFYYASGSINYKMTLITVDGFSWKAVTKVLVSLGEILWIDSQIILKRIMNLQRCN